MMDPLLGRRAMIVQALIVAILSVMEEECLAVAAEEARDILGTYEEDLIRLWNERIELPVMED